MSKIVTLTTDFGIQDPYVGAVCGSLLSICPSAKLVTISHEVPQHDVLRGAYTLAAAAPVFPRGTVHLAVVDPGVGTERRGLVVQSRKHLYVGPDNGLLSGVLEQEPDAACFSIENTALFRPQVHPTFHGRDIFAPVAAHLAMDLDPAEVGPAIDDPVCSFRSPVALPSSGVIKVAVISVDRFGNVTTQLTPSSLARLLGERSANRLALGDEAAPLPWHRTYGEAAPDELFLLWGSSGYLELAIAGQSAAVRLDLRPGDELEFRIT